MSNLDYSASGIKNIPALDFNTEIVDLGIPGILDILGLSGYMAHQGLQTTPFKNQDAFIVSKARLSQLLAGMTNKIIELEQDRVSLSLGTFSFTGAQVVNGVLPFSSLSGLTRPPSNAGQFLVMKSGIPIASSDPYTRSAGTAILIPGTGIRFTESWEADEQGVVWVFTGRTGEMIKCYTFYASSFSGAGNRIITLADLGPDWFGNTINPLPVLSSQIKVIDATWKTEGVSYNVSGFGTNPVITLLYDAEPDQIFNFLVLR